MAKKRKTPESLSDALYKAVAEYLEAYGWSVAVIGGTAVQQPIGRAKLNYEFVVRFTGCKKK